MGEIAYIANYFLWILLFEYQYIEGFAVLRRETASPHNGSLGPLKGIVMTSLPSETTMKTRRLHAPTVSDLEALTDVLLDCVEGGASVNFMLPVARSRLLDFWQGVAQGVARGERALLVADDDRGIAGTVQLVLKQPDNQPHRADLAKMLVHRRARRQGMGDALMKAAEQTALECGKTLLVLDTASDEAERLYERHGWVRLGSIPDYALWPQGGWCPASIYYRHLAPPRLL